MKSHTELPIFLDVEFNLHSNITVTYNKIGNNEHIHRIKGVVWEFFRRGVGVGKNE
jgi:hypothetical protein